MTPAEAYARWRVPIRLCENLPLPVGRTVSELEIQARWFSGKYSRQLQTTTGEPVEIVYPGIWNREPGPDFCEAVIQFGDQPPRRGSIELDTHRRDWENHGHAVNPAFNDVILHLFVEAGNGEFFTRTEQNRFVPQVRIDLAEDDLVPFPPLATQGRCSAPLAALEPEVRRNVIAAAAHFRLQRKAEAFTRLAGRYGWDDALFQMLATTLGYKENKLPFEVLAQRLGLKHLRSKPVLGDALLFGCAGFLDATSLREFAPDTQVYLRALWEEWWVVRIQWQRLVLPRSAWKLTGARPANHPQRRLAALGLLAGNWAEVARVFREPTLEKLEDVLGKLTHPYWSEHYTISSRRSATPIALIGRSRILEILVNVAIPVALSTNLEIWRTLGEVRQPLENRKLKTGILRLFGPDAKMGSLDLLQQQGILQIYEDFCLRDFSDCARCPFPQKVLDWECV